MQLVHHNLNRKHWMRVRDAASLHHHCPSLFGSVLTPSLPPIQGGGQYRRGVGRQCTGQRTEGTLRRKERSARCAAKVPGVIDVMTVYPSCCVATA